MRAMRVVSPHFRQYGHRRLCHGESFLAADRHAEILKLCGLAEFDNGNTDSNDLEILRANYRKLAGHKADGRWSAGRLQAEIYRLTK